MRDFFWEVRRLSGYVLGFILFYAPFALFQKALIPMLGLHFSPTIHSFCLRIPVEHLTDGTFFSRGDIEVLSVILLCAVTFILGPFFCGLLCPAGAVGEYASRAVPDRFKIDWGAHLPVLAIRCGFFAAFITAPLAGGYLACKYCNFYIFDLFFNYVLLGRVVAFSTSMILTALLWMILFGLFTRGGRGYCTLFCPVGALQGIIFAASRKAMPALGRLHIKESDCTRCGRCEDKCPMNSMRVTVDGIKNNLHLCILCLNCVHKCPAKCIKYSFGKKEEKESC